MCFLFEKRSNWNLRYLQAGMKYIENGMGAGALAGGGRSTSQIRKEDGGEARRESAQGACSR